ncbi:MAG: hypothetical protein HC887_02825 [Desulfobacteraceae bacterium]|nr:hypothetical protein [Desulfobacteraceae bacterium]
MRNLLRCNMLKAAMVLAIMMTANPLHSACDTGCIAVGNDLKLNICSEYQGIRYGTVFDFLRMLTDYIGNWMS